MMLVRGGRLTQNGGTVNGRTAERRNDGTAERQNGGTAERRNGGMAERLTADIILERFCRLIFQLH
jgi:hypothetical protein